MPPRHDWTDDPSQPHDTCMTCGTTYRTNAEKQPGSEFYCRDCYVDLMIALITQMVQRETVVQQATRQAIGA